MADKEDPAGGDVDFGDPRVVAAWLVRVDGDLDDSDRQALAEEISRQFRRAPATMEGSDLQSELQRTQARLRWVVEQMETQESADVRTQLGQLRERFVADVEGLQQRVADGPGS